MEFDLIHRHFKTPFAQLTQSNGESVLAGIGDDCAVLGLTAGQSLYVSTDTLVEGVHFFADDPADAIGWKALACNLSDLAACGAKPLGFTLNLSLPKVSEPWLAGFSTGLLAIASQYDCPLIGGDTTSAGRNSAATISITVFGQAPLEHNGFNRADACLEDDIWVSGTPGLARLGLLIEYARREQLAQHVAQSDLAGVQFLLNAIPADLTVLAVNALQCPTPRIDLGISLRGLARAGLDLSDGLGGDLLHIAQASSMRANLSDIALKAIWLEKWPAIAQHSDSSQLLNTLMWVTMQGGDDFELCWSANCDQRDAIQSLNSSAHCIGHLSSGQGVWLMQAGADAITINSSSYTHFSESSL